MFISLIINNMVHWEIRLSQQPFFIATEQLTGKVFFYTGPFSASKVVS